MFSTTDLDQIKSYNIAPDTVLKQIENFKKGFPPMGLKRAATPGNGIMVLTDREQNHYSSYFTENKDSFSLIKFVPASGAASRMFKSLFAFMENNLGRNNQEEALLNDSKLSEFFDRLTEFAFYDDLKSCLERNGLQLSQLLDNFKYAEILEYLLKEKGLNYGSLPKGLLKFHHYPNENRMPVEEHLVEGAAFAKNKEGKVYLHFTVSPEHEPEFKKRLESLIPVYEEKLGVRYEISYSQQLKSTDTLAVDEENNPFRNSDGTLLFRPAGHGALLQNLNQLQSDIVFLQNIDNVVPDRLKEHTVKNKKILGGVLLETHHKIKNILKEIENGTIDEIGLRKFLKEVLCIEIPEGANFEEMKNKLDRPLRVCGMVINTGEPGGGPYWCKNPDGTVSLQIVESSQFNTEDQEQMDIVKSSTHFNPVDVVAFKSDFDDQPYNLLEHVDDETAFISSKSKDGKALKAMELPGLWNGSMSDWNTLFVEVPEVTFNPVKEVNNLLKDEHQ